MTGFSGFHFVENLLIICTGIVTDGGLPAHDQNAPAFWIDRDVALGRHGRRPAST
ncbi:MAG: hypothetical protein LBI67_06020 [Treponema sp.]|jgi:hypothetical protein|nr:hypothetical protein [Treponema sp.]